MTQSFTLLLLFSLHSTNNELPPGVLESLCYVESKHDINAVAPHDGGSPSLGICQVKYSTSVWLGFSGTASELMEPKNNIKYAALYLAYQLKRYDNNIDRALVAYNRGNAIGLKESSYSKKVKKVREAISQQKRPREDRLIADSYDFAR